MAWTFKLSNVHILSSAVIFQQKQGNTLFDFVLNAYILPTLTNSLTGS